MSGKKLSDVIQVLKQWVLWNGKDQHWKTCCATAVQIVLMHSVDKCIGGTFFLYEFVTYILDIYTQDEQIA